MDFDKLCMMFTMQEPFYGILLSSMRRIECPGMNTAGVGRSGNVFVLYYDRKWIEALPVDTALEVLRHEVLHIAFNHLSLWEDDRPSQELQKIRNVAADLEVNSYVKKDRLDEKAKASWMFAEKFDWKPMEGTREYYSRLISLAEQKQKEEEQKEQAQNPEDPCNGGQGGEDNSQQQQQQQQQKSQQQQSQGQPNSSPSQQEEASEEEGQNDMFSSFGKGQKPISKKFTDQLGEMDDHSMWPSCDTESEMEEMKQLIDTMLDFAAEEVEKAQGTIPGEIAGKIEKIRKKPKPVADWKRYFRRYLGNEFTELIRKSKKRESRRFPDAAGNRHQRKSNILVAIDTSGSVSMPEYREFFGQIKTLEAIANFHVIECDATIQYEYDYHGKQNDTLHGGGGTDFQPVIDRYNAERRKYDALVYFTDGYCNIPKDTPKDTLWVISSNGDQSDRNRYRVNGASVAFIPKKGK